MYTAYSFSGDVNRDGISISQASLTPSLYDSANYNDRFWDKTTSPPTLLKSEIYYREQAFTVDVKRNGTSISQASLTPSLYNSSNYNSRFWDTTTSPPTLLKSEIYYREQSFTVDANRQGADITGINARKQASYPTYPFATVWAIVEDETYPFHLSGEGVVNADPPLTSRKSYVFIAEDVTGTLFHEGKVYKSLKRSVVFDPISGSDGGFVTHYYGGDTANDFVGDGPYVFKWSGTQDATRPGGYGDIQPLTERTVALNTTESSNVAFYYMSPGVPLYDDLLYISDGVGTIPIVVLLTGSGVLRVKMSDGIVKDVGLVTTDDASASPIRVLTPTGVMALQTTTI